MDAAACRSNLSTLTKTSLEQRRERSLLLPFPDVVEAGSRPQPRRRGGPRTFQSLDLFTGAGGLTLGLERAGFEPALAVEVDPSACRTFTGTFAAVKLQPRPVEELDFREFAGIDLIAGGPPCQPFSSGGKGLAGSDARDMIPQFVRAVREARPRAFLMENVPALFGSTHQAYLRRAVGELMALGYDVATAVLNAAEYGVPQKRRRGFVVGLREGRFTFPPPTHGPRGTRPFIPAGLILRADAVIGEPNASQVFYAKNPDLRPSPYDGQMFNGGGRPIDLDAPSHTILASAGGNKTHFLDTLGLAPLYHAHLMRGGKPRVGTLEGARRLTPEESALIQSFPPSMKFHGSRSARYMQIGNAVPPVLSEALGNALRLALM